MANPSHVTTAQSNDQLRSWMRDNSNGNLDVSGHHFSKINFSHVDFSRLNINGCTFTDCRFTESSFANQTLQNVKFKLEDSNRKLDINNFKKTIFSNCRMENCHFDNCDFHECTFDGFTFTGTDAFGINSASNSPAQATATLVNVSIWGNSTINNVTIQNTSAKRFSLTDLKINGQSRFHFTESEQINFRNSTLTDFTLTFDSECTNLNLEKTKCRAITILTPNNSPIKAYGKESEFENADFKDITFSHSDFSHAKFEDVNFKSASLNDAEFVGSSFSKCNFENANFENATLHNMKLINCTGLHLAKNLERTNADNFIEGIEHYKCSGKWGWGRDWSHWGILRLLGKLPILGLSYTIFISMPLLCFFVSFYNAKLALLHEWGIEHLPNESIAYWGSVQKYILKLHPVTVPWDIACLYFSSLFLSIAGSIYALRCPEKIKEFSMEQWVYQLKEPRLHYFGYMFSKTWWRIVCSSAYFIGILLLVPYLVNRLCTTIMYFI